MINLIPSELKEERKYGRRNQVLLTYSISLLITAVAIAAIMTAALQLLRSTGDELQKELDATTAEVTTLKTNVAEIEQIAGRLETAQKLNDQSVRFSELVPGIASVLPEGVVLNALSLTGGSTDILVLDVDMRSADLAPVLLRNLVESDLFEAADISSLTPRGGVDDTGESENQYKFNASVSASFTGSSDTKKKSSAAAAQAEAAAQQAGAQ